MAEAFAVAGLASSIIIFVGFNVKLIKAFYEWYGEFLGCRRGYVLLKFSMRC